MSYSANQFISQYLVGKGLVPTSYDYQFYYFVESESLMFALAEMPLWMKINFANLWE